MHLRFLLLSGTLYEMANSVDPDQTTPLLLKDLGLVSKLGVQTDLSLDPGQCHNHALILIGHCFNIVK